MQEKKSRTDTVFRDQKVDYSRDWLTLYQPIIYFLFLNTQLICISQTLLL